MESLRGSDARAEMMEKMNKEREEGGRDSGRVRHL